MNLFVASLAFMYINATNCSNTATNRRQCLVRMKHLIKI